MTDASGGTAGARRAGAASEYANLKVEVADRIATITIDRIRKFNALNAETEAEIDRAVRAAIDSEEVAGIVVTGAGERAFCAGADIEMISGFTGAQAKEFAYDGQAVFRRIEMTPKPTVAAVNGLALGGGCELALACHLRVASENAVFALPEVTLGVIPGHGGTVRLPRVVGRGMALEMILSGAKVDARRAYEIGLVNRVVPQPELLDACRRLLASILDKAPLAVRYALESTMRAETMSVDDALYLEATLFGMACGTEDMQEGTRAFLEKRKPEFKRR
ncbi:MAG: enoyl-CoA hydratase/isomerase family protein [Gemmatimonadota bacterium]